MRYCRKRFSSVRVDIALDALTEVTVAATVGEVHDQTDGSPCKEQLDRIQTQADEQQQTTTYGQRPYQPDERRFEMALAATFRARQIANGSQPMMETNRDKPTVVALRELAAGNE